MISVSVGTPAARMKKVPSNVVKKRSRELTSVFESFTPYNGMEGNIEKIWITDIATDEIHLVGHTKGYVQVLVVGPESLLGSSAIVKITSVGRWSVFGDVIEILSQCNSVTSPTKKKDTSNKEICSPCFNQEDSCSCSSPKQEAVACDSDVCESNGCSVTTTNKLNNSYSEVQTPQNSSSLLLRRKATPAAAVEMEDDVRNQKLDTSHVHDHDWGFLDTALVAGILMSLLTIIALVFYVS